MQLGHSAATCPPFRWVSEKDRGKEAEMRAARRVSESGYYHVILRGDGKRRIFEDDDDRREFLKLLSEQVVSRGVDIVAWCLMDNHVHLVVQDSSSCLSIAIGSLAMRYAQRFNMRTGHVGHVFQERFKSSPIESDAYLLEASATFTITLRRAVSVVLRSTHGAATRNTSRVHGLPMRKLFLTCLVGWKASKSSAPPCPR